MLRLKEDETYINFGDDGAAAREREGVYRRDTRYLSHYRIDVGPVALLGSSCIENVLSQHFATVGVNRNQTLAWQRTLTMRTDGFDDCWTISNTDWQPQSGELRLHVEGEFRDLFAGHFGDSAAVTVARVVTDYGVRLGGRAADGIGMQAEISADRPGDDLQWSIALAPGETTKLTFTVRLNAADDGVLRALPSYAEWRAPFACTLPDRGHQAAHDRAVDDLRMLLLATEYGPYPAAGMPWFVTIFGRDALITAMMLLDWQPGVALSVVRMLAAHQGKVTDAFREEEPGRILHEMRRGELSRTGRIPFGRYYGAIDSTPLFVIALAAYVDATGDRGRIAEFAPNWRAAMGWLADRQDSDGLVAFTPSGSGLAVQSWKDSSDSMNHADGTPARAPLSVAEVQGYAFAAFRAGAAFADELGDAAGAAAFTERAARLQRSFHDRFWLDDLGTYAMALDADGAPLAVLSSDPGHLLWCGIVPEAIAPRLVATMLGSALWSGWGVRTLGATERRFNAVSYHNGSVWPHDTALLAWGLQRYGFAAEARQVAVALFDCAAEQPWSRLPELFAGETRHARAGPLAYAHACSPQSWAAASLPLLARFLTIPY